MYRQLRYAMHDSTDIDSPCFKTTQSLFIFLFESLTFNYACTYLHLLLSVVLQDGYLLQGLCFFTCTVFLCGFVAAHWHAGNLSSWFFLLFGFHNCMGWHSMHTYIVDWPALHCRATEWNGVSLALVGGLIHSMHI